MDTPIMMLAQLIFVVSQFQTSLLSLARRTNSSVRTTYLTTRAANRMHETLHSLHRLALAADIVPDIPPPFTDIITIAEQSGLFAWTEDEHVHVQPHPHDYVHTLLSQPTAFLLPL